MAWELLEGETSSYEVALWRVLIGMKSLIEAWHSLRNLELLRLPGLDRSLRSFLNLVQICECELLGSLFIDAVEIILLNARAGLRLQRLLLLV